MKFALLFLLTILSPSFTNSQNLYFPPILGDEWETLDPNELNWCDENIADLYSFLEAENTKAFIVLKGGKIVLEKYFNGFGPDSLWYWASAGKTVTAALTGIAQEEGMLNIDDPTNLYLGNGWTSAPSEKEDLITIRHQLSMTSGLDDGVADVYCTTPDCLVYKADAGTRWAYHNGPYTNLSKVIEAASGLNYNTFYYTRLASKTGMGGLWAYIGYNRLLFTKARSMARFGLLIQNGGVWDGTSVLTNSEYFEDMINTSQNFNKSYGYLWWLNGKDSYLLPGSQFELPGPICPDAPQDMYAAMGANGQFLNIAPSEDLLFVRMGNAPDSSLVPNFFNNEIWQHINNLACDPNVASGEVALDEMLFYPNPVSENIYIDEKLVAGRFEVQIFDALGSEVYLSKNSSKIIINDLTAGVYLLQYNSESFTKTEKFIKK